MHEYRINFHQQRGQDQTLISFIVYASYKHNVADRMMQDEEYRKQLVKRSINDDLERVVDVESGRVFEQRLSE